MVSVVNTLHHDVLYDFTNYSLLLSSLPLPPYWFGLVFILTQCIELPFLFGSKIFFETTMSQKDQMLSQSMIYYWTSFSRYICYYLMPEIVKTPTGFVPQESGVELLYVIISSLSALPLGAPSLWSQPPVQLNSAH